MNDMENAIEKGNCLAEEDLDRLILKVKHDYWERLRAKAMPRHCGLCDLFGICRVVNPKLICPWFI